MTLELAITAQNALATSFTQLGLTLGRLPDRRHHPAGRSRRQDRRAQRHGRRWRYGAYTQFQAAQAMRDAAQNPGGGARQPQVSVSAPAWRWGRPWAMRSIRPIRAPGRLRRKPIRSQLRRPRPRRPRKRAHRPFAPNVANRFRPAPSSAHHAAPSCRARNQSQTVSLIALQHKSRSRVEISQPGRVFAVMRLNQEMNKRVADSGACHGAGWRVYSSATLPRVAGHCIRAEWIPPPDRT